MTMTSVPLDDLAAQGRLIEAMIRCYSDRDLDEIPELEGGDEDRAADEAARDSDRLPGHSDMCDCFGCRSDADAWPEPYDERGDR